jgi:hypothetical protein
MASSTLLQALEHHYPAGQLDAAGGERQGFGDAVAGGVRYAAEGAHLALGLASTAATTKARRSSSGK